jgi:hypothetical protein
MMNDTFAWDIMGLTWVHYGRKRKIRFMIYEQRAGMVSGLQAIIYDSLRTV